MAAPLAAALGAAAKQLGQKILVSQAVGNRGLQKLVAVIAGTAVLVPVVVVLAFGAVVIHVMDILHAKPTVRLGIDAYRAAEECPFASDSVYGRAIGTAYLLGSAYVLNTLTSGNLTQWGGYRNPLGSAGDVPADMLRYTNPGELRAGGSVHDELGLQSNYLPGDWTTVLAWTHLPVIGWTPALWGGEHGVGFLLILPSQWRAWIQDVPAGLSHQLDPFKPYDSFLVMACHLMSLEDQNGYGVEGVFSALVSFGDDTVMQLINAFVDAVSGGVSHLLDALKALWNAFTGSGDTFANLVLNFMGRSQDVLGQVQPSAAALADIPPDYLRLIIHWADVYGMDWTILAGVLKVECDFGRCISGPSHGISSAGAEGPAQFLPSTFAVYHLKGMGNIWSPNDAIAAAAHYLTALGVNRDPARALCAYNGAGGATCGYADLVMRYAREYRGPAIGPPVSNPSSAAGVAVSAAESALGTPYVWGGESLHGFDCSGLVQWAYAKAGIQLPRTSEEQYAAGPHVPPGQPLMPGDLVFFVGAGGPSDPPPGHVGIALSGTEMIDAPSQGSVVQIQSFSMGNGYMGATRPAAR